MNTLLEAYGEQRRALLTRARAMTDDDRVALMLLDLVAQTRQAITNKRIRWCAGVRMNADPCLAGKEGLAAILMEYNEGKDEGPEETLSEAARYRKTHRPIWLEFHT